MGNVAVIVFGKLIAIGPLSAPAPNVVHRGKYNVSGEVAKLKA
jgi:hypothetical protein